MKNMIACRELDRVVPDRAVFSDIVDGDPSASVPNRLHILAQIVAFMEISGPGNAYSSKNPGKIELSKRRAF